MTATTADELSMTLAGFESVLRRARQKLHGQLSGLRHELEIVWREITKMNRQNFESTVQTYGADTERWPDAQRADMLAFVDLLTARQSVIATLKTDEPDLQTLANAVTRSENAIARLNGNFHGLLRDIILSLSPEGREKIGERLSRHQRDRHAER